jgi:hypothetical protein
MAGFATPSPYPEWTVRETNVSVAIVAADWAAALRGDAVQARAGGRER